MNNPACRSGAGHKSGKPCISTELWKGNGSKLISLTLAPWVKEHGVMLDFIKPAELTQNTFIDRLNRTYWIEILDFYLFRTLNETRAIT